MHFFLRLLLIYGLIGIQPWLEVRAQDNPTPAESSSFKLSFAERFRFVTWDNAINLDKSNSQASTFTRHRTSVTAQWKPTDRIEILAKLTNEFRYYFHPKGKDFSIHEFFFDNLYVQWKDAAGLPVSLKLGRQNINLGEGFVVMDGHPLDGSRSIYFNAARFDFHLGKDKNLIFFYTYQPETDDILPIVNDQDQMLIEQPEEGIGLYYSGKHGRFGFDAYLIRKNILCNDTHAVGSGINTIGSRITVPLMKNLSITGEGAVQCGTYGDADRSSVGGYCHLDYGLDEGLFLPKKMTLGAIWLGGDDPETDKWEGWDPLFSRWPKWSESYIYTLIPEYGGRVAYWSNLSSLYGTLEFYPARPVRLTFTYHYLTAPEPSTGATFPGGEGHTRGHLFISQMTFRLHRTLSGHLLWETFSPGDFYKSDADDFHWFRCELYYRL